MAIQNLRWCLWLIVSRRTFASVKLKFETRLIQIEVSVGVSKNAGSTSTLFSSQPIKYCISLEGTFFSAREHLSNQARQILVRGTVDFGRPKRQYPELPRPVSTVYFIKVLDISDNW